MRRTQMRRRSAFTLIEILVTTMVMLIMVLAMSQMFALVGRHVSDGRALMELQGQVRTAGFRLQEDLDGVTILARQSPRNDWKDGYIEVFEGVDFNTGDAFNTIGNDLNPWWINDTTVPITVALPFPSIDPATGNTDFARFFAAAKYNDPLSAAGTAYGDIDDVLMFTARSTGKPFVGRIDASLVGGAVGTSVAIESHDAEMVYWTQWTDVNANNEIDLGEMTLHRRILLIRPDLLVANMPVYGAAVNPPRMTSADMALFHNENDLSVHPEQVLDYSQSPPVPTAIRLVSNSLKDLATRANRVAHLPNIGVAGSPQIKRILANTTDFPLSNYYPNYLHRAWLPLHFGARAGEDIVQSDLLAFDVKVYDPTAELRQFDTGGDLLAPGDLAWDLAIPGNSPPGSTVGQGAYVDVGYGVRTPPATASTFSSRPDAKSGLRDVSGTRLAPTYDTWTWAYEHDGVNQELANVNYTCTGITDEAADGVDNDPANPSGLNGVDDLGERETSPPYDAALRGIQVSIRVIELDTRQVRQSSIVSKFMPE